MSYPTKYSAETKRSLLETVAEGMPILAAAARFCVAPSTAQRWVTAARAGEADGASAQRYEKTPKGFLMRAYRNMQSRIEGVQTAKAHLYMGKLLVVTREDFYAWSWASKEFHDLFSVWTAAGYDRRLTPSVDRIDSSKGYSLDNMRWITHAANSSLGAKSKYRQNKERVAIYAAAGVTNVKA